MFELMTEAIMEMQQSLFDVSVDEDHEMCIKWNHETNELICILAERKLCRELDADEIERQVGITTQSLFTPMQKRYTVLHRGGEGNAAL